MWGYSESASKNTSDPILKTRKERIFIFPLACDLVLAPSSGGDAREAMTVGCKHLKFSQPLVSCCLTTDVAMQRQWSDNLFSLTNSNCKSPHCFIDYLYCDFLFKRSQVLNRFENNTPASDPLLYSEMPMFHQYKQFFCHTLLKCFCALV